MAASYVESLSAFLESLSQSSPAMARKVARSVGKAAWLAGTTFLVFGLPLIWAMEREALAEMEYDQQMAEQAEQQAMRIILLGTDT